LSSFANLNRPVDSHLASLCSWTHILRTIPTNHMPHPFIHKFYGKAGLAQHIRKAGCGM
jgi:hypothetical protein